MRIVKKGFISGMQREYDLRPPNQHPTKFASSRPAFESARRCERCCNPRTPSIVSRVNVVEELISFRYWVRNDFKSGSKDIINLFEKPTKWHCCKFKDAPALLAYCLTKPATASVLFDCVAGVVGIPYMSCKQVGVIADGHDDGTVASMLNELFDLADTGLTLSGWRLR